MRKSLYVVSIIFVLLTNVGCGVSETDRVAFKDVDYYLDDRSESKYITFKEVCFPRLNQSCISFDVWVHPEDVKVVVNDNTLGTAVSVTPSITNRFLPAISLVWANQVTVHVPDVHQLGIWAKWLNEVSAKMDEELRKKRYTRTVIPRLPGY